MAATVSEASNEGSMKWVMGSVLKVMRPLPRIDGCIVGPRTVSLVSVIVEAPNEARNDW
jgi:hypothetical protein